MNRYKVILLFVLAIIMACSPPKKIQQSTATTASKMAAPKVKNIIFMVGDGMGLGQITAGMYMNNNYIVFEEFPVVGLSKTSSSDKLVTDSAAGATAFACGIKTYNGAIGVSADTLPMPTILEAAEKRGMATGLVATSTITHATPASFIAHQPSRKLYDEIAADFLNTPVDVMIGGGWYHFDGNIRDDERNLLDSLRNKGYLVDTIGDNKRLPAFLDSIPRNTDKIAIFTAASSPKPVSEGRTYLKNAAVLATERLAQSNEGFFLMIEGSQIDWGGHANEVDYIVTEMLDFNSTIETVLDFVKRDGETLLVITADHETGGFALNPKSVMNDSISAGFTTDYHTATMVPVFAYGPGSEAFAGIYENTAIYNKMMNALGLKQE